MCASFDPLRESVVWIADTGLFIACGRRQHGKFTALERFVRRNELTLVVPRRVYAELGGAPERSTPGHLTIDSAIEAGWVRVADEPDYADGTVARVIDDARSYIARSSNRNEDRVEKADTALAAVAAERLDGGTAEFAYVLTTDIDAGEAVVAALEANGFENRARFKNGFDFVDDIT